MRPGAIGVAAVLVVAACSSSGSPTKTTPANTTLTVTSEQFKANAKIPEAYTCKGAGTFPTIEWTGDLSAAKAIAVVVDDPDAPDGTYTHLVVLDLPATATSLSATPPSGAKLGLNSDGANGWTPPCPPSGTHHYRFTVYGLSKPTGLAEGAAIDTATAAIQETTVTQGTLIGLVSA